ncbi:MAG: hypothetical protein LBQ02_00540 [Candidatus Nomurabacteria bacterium]|jgi:hypothetical protein|nr:hypothetical protein [Candidatus Nomurabacteria bacterium]
MVIQGDRGYLSPEYYMQEDVDFLKSKRRTIKWMVAIFVISAVLLVTVDSARVRLFVVPEENFNALPIMERMELAEDFVYAYDYLKETELRINRSVDGFFDQKVEKSVSNLVADNINDFRQIRLTGEELRRSKSNLEIFMMSVLSIPAAVMLTLVFFLIWYMVISIFLLIEYAVDCRRARHFLIDVPRTQTCVIWIIATTLPLGWLFYLVSAVRLYFFKRQRAKQKAAVREQSIALGCFFPGPDGVTPITVQDLIKTPELRQESDGLDGSNQPSEPDEQDEPNEPDEPSAPSEPNQPTMPDKPSEIKVVFNHNPEEAYNCYAHLRHIGDKESYFKAHIQSLEKEEYAQIWRLERLGREMRSKQHEVNRLRTRLHSTKMMMAGFSSDEAVIQAEFQQIQQFQGVIAIGTDHYGILNILVRVRVPYNGKTYDLGDWEVCVSQTTFSAQCLRNGLLSQPDEDGEEAEAHPIYPDGNYFCFGDGADAIQESLNCGQIAHAINSIISALHSFNDDEDRAQIPEFFKEVEE